MLFGDSITEQSFRSGGWGAALADTYSRKVSLSLSTVNVNIVNVGNFWDGGVDRLM